MHPGFFHHWRQRASSCEPSEYASAHGSCGPGELRGGCGAQGRHGHHEHRAGGFDEDGGGGFGVRRPLRFLAQRLELDDDQVTKVATILSTLKTERAQAAVDGRRRITTIADVIEAAAFDNAKAESAATEQVKIAERLRDAVTAALRDMHAALTDEQRKRLAYLLRTGALTI